MNYLKTCPNCSTTLRFPASQETVLVRCPVCSHRFQFNSSSDTNFQKEIETRSSFHFQPSKREYLNLILDLLYAPIDFFKTKYSSYQTKRKNTSGIKSKPKVFIEILLFLILSLYLLRALKTEDVKQRIDGIKLEEEALPPANDPAPPTIDSSEPTLEI